MALTWFTPPGSILANTTQPLGFQASGPVTAISVSFGPRRLEECAYRDGVFLYPYLRSTRVANVFSLVRDGGWPAHPHAFVGEESPPVATLWDVIYERDLRTLADQTLTWDSTFAGTITMIDGIPWWAGPPSGAATPWANLENGAGIRLRGRQPPSGGNNHAGAYAGVWLPGVSGFDSLKRTLVQFRMGGTFETGLEIGVRTSIDSWNYPYHEASSCRLHFAPVGQIQGVSLWSSNFVVSYGTARWARLSDDLSNVVIGGEFTPMHSRPAGWMDDWRQHYIMHHEGPGFPAPEDMPVYGSWMQGAMPEPRNIGVGAWVAHATNGATRTAYITHVRILQRANLM